jgi:hypothetical protein
MKKRNVLLLVFVLLVSVKLFAPVISNSDEEKLLWNYQRTQSRVRVQKDNARELSRYLDAIGHSESRNNPKAYNRYGYVGKYQFGFAARKSCGYSEIKFKDFINNPSVWSEEDQEAAMITLLSKNESHLKNVIHKYNGKVVKGVTITKSGILAAAHLAGAGGVKRYFRNGSNPRDAYGTGLEDYLFKFSGFNI